MPRHVITARRRRAALAAGVLAACAALPAAADAAIVSQEGATLVYSAIGGERNHPRVLSLGTSAVTIQESATTRLGSQTRACAPSPFPADPARSLRCGLSGITAIEFRLEDGNDSFGSFHPFPIRVLAGSGDDTYVAAPAKFGEGFGSPRGASQVAFQGGSGRDEASYQLVTGEEGVIVSKDGFDNDGRRGDHDNIPPDVEVLRGSGQGDVLSGSANGDVFHSTGGADLLLGNNGDDLFLMGAVGDGPTRVIGGPDRDTVTYAARSEKVVVSADSDATLDGEAGEGDKVEGAEVIEGGGRSDAIFTPPATELGYRLIGHDGNDILSTAAGRDRLIGGRGEDTLASGPDRDVIEAQDGERELRIDCGSGGPDQVFTDFREVRSSGCEIITPPRLPIGRVGLPATAVARADGTARLSLSWAHPRSWKRLRSVRVQVRDGSRTLGALTVLPRAGRVRRDGAGVRLAPGSRPARDGRRVSARLSVRVPAVDAGPLTADVVATDTTGRRQAETRSIALERSTR